MKTIMLFLLGLVLLLAVPRSALAQAAPVSEPHADNAAIQAHATSQRFWSVMDEVASEEGAHAPHTPIDTTLLDFQLPGTQPGGLIAPFASPATCSGCHVDHIVTNFAGSMMANSARDPLFRAALQVANKDAAFGGDTCIRCHVPNAWLNGRASVAGNPDSTDGSLINAEDLQGVACSTCHRLVPPTPIAGEATIDAAERAALTGPFITGNAAYLIDRNDVRRGPFDIAAAPHAVAQSSYLQSAELCATCHDIDNPLLTFDAALSEFKLNALNTAAGANEHLFPIERTYSEWKASEFANGGVTGLDQYPGIRRSTDTTTGPITVCQDCHMPMIAAPIVNGGPTRRVGLHQWAGGSAAWQDGIISVWDGIDGGLNKTQTTLDKTLGKEMLERAADLDVAIVGNQIEVKITNNTGHKLPTGYAEGRRMWLEIYQLRGPTPVFTSGLMAGVVGPLINDPFLKKYEIKLGLTDNHAQAIGRPEIAGEGFHFILNNQVFGDNRIPPRGFTNAAFVARDMQPVGAIYADGQYWDTTYYPLHPEADSISVRLMYQTATSEYLDFLASEANFTVNDAVRGPTNWGQIVDDLRDQNIGKPVVMAAQQLFIPRQFVATSGTDTGACTDSAAPCRTITYALSQALEGGEIRVAAGVYPEFIQVTKPISLTGGFTFTNWIITDPDNNVTILDGQQSYRPLTINADRVRIEGFTIRNGNATGSGGVGGGIYIGAANVVDQATLFNLRLENNTASTVDGGRGGGLAVEMGNTFNLPSLLTLNNIVVISNTASTGSLSASGGGMYLAAVGNSPLRVDVTNVLVQNNIAGNDFSSNGGGISLSLNGGEARLNRVRILGNRAAQVETFLGGPSSGGGIYMDDSSLSLVNVLIAGNTGERGEAIWVQSDSNVGSTVSMNYVTLANNVRTAGEAGSAIHNQGPHIYFTLANTLISGNPVAFTNQESAQPPAALVDSVLVDDNIGTVISGTMTITGTVLRGSAAFVNAGAGDFHLSAASAAIDQGNGNPPPIDLDTVFRPLGTTTDIGAYEFIPPNLNDQTISFAPLTNKTLGDPPFTVNATASSGLPVSFISLTPVVCTVSGNTVTLVTTGTCRIEATQPGNAAFNPAPPVVQAFAVKNSQKTDQTITFGILGNKTLSDAPFTLSATASSGLVVGFSSNTTSICTVAGVTVTLIAPGTCSITAFQEGNVTFNPATPVTQSFLVTSTAGGDDEQKIYLPMIARN